MGERTSSEVSSIIGRSKLEILVQDSLVTNSATRVEIKITLPGSTIANLFVEVKVSSHSTVRMIG